MIRFPEMNQEQITDAVYETFSSIPLTWTHQNNINFLAIRFKSKLLGIEWSSEEDFVNLCTLASALGIIEQEGDYHIRRVEKKEIINA